MNNFFRIALIGKDKDWWIETLDIITNEEKFIYFSTETKKKLTRQINKELKNLIHVYAEWNKINREKLSLYYEKKEPDIPLEDNKEFRILKNDIIMAAVQMDTYLMNQGYSTEQKVGFLFTNVFRAFLKLFQNNYNRHANRLGKQIDRKLMSAIEAKKAALGIKTEKGVAYDYNEPTMNL